MPIYLPFGIFPLNRGRHSGLLPPQFASSQDFGLGLEGLGYYKVLNENWDVTVRSNIYSYGGWSVDLRPEYYKRYKYKGSLDLSIQKPKYLTVLPMQRRSLPFPKVFCNMEPFHRFKSKARYIFHRKRTCGQHEI